MAQTEPVTEPVKSREALVVARPLDRYYMNVHLFGVAPWVRMSERRDTFFTKDGRHGQEDYQDIGEGK